MTYQNPNPNAINWDEVPESCEAEMEFDGMEENDPYPGLEGWSEKSCPMA